MDKEMKISYTLFADKSELNDVEQKLYERAKQVRKQAYAPYSNFFVGCSVLLKNGEIIVGNNQENAVFPAGTCAEQVALNWTSANFPNEQIEKIFIVGAPKDIEKHIAPVPPCGTCRQVISEHEDRQQHNIEVYFASVVGEIYKINSVKTMLPFTFGKDLL